MCRQRAGCNAGTLTAASLVEAAARDVQEKGRLQTWNSKGWRPEGLVEAAARELEGFKGFKGFKRLKPGKRQAWMPEQERAMCRQRAGCNPGTAKADGQRAWWKLPRGMCRQRAGCPGTAKAAGQRAWWQLPRGSSAAVGGGSCREGVGGF